MVDSVLIVDDNPEFVTLLYKYIQSEIKYIKTIGIASNGNEALEYLTKTKPDIIILDLKMPKLNGIGFLKKINNKDIKVILISGEIQLINELLVKDYCNIKKIYIKPFELYKLKEDFKSLRSSTDNYDDKELMVIIDKELQEFNFNKTSIGYRYLIECVIEVFRNQNKIINIEKDLFPCVAEKLNVKKPQTIKWTLRKLIDSMVRYTNTETILKYFPYTKNPTTKMFISMMNACLISKSRFKRIKSSKEIKSLTKKGEKIYKIVGQIIDF